MTNLVIALPHPARCQGFLRQPGTRENRHQPPAKTLWTGARGPPRREILAWAANVDPGPRNVRTSNLNRETRNPGFQHVFRPIASDQFFGPPPGVPSMTKTEPKEQEQCML